MIIRELKQTLTKKKQARKSSEDTLVAGYVRFENVWARQAWVKKVKAKKNVSIFLTKLEKN